MALTEVVKEVIWLGGLLDELGVGQKQISIYSNSLSVICLAKNPVFHVHTKHIDIRYHFVQKIMTVKNPANMLTKVVTMINFNHCLDVINITKFDCVVEGI